MKEFLLRDLLTIPRQSDTDRSIDLGYEEMRARVTGEVGQSSDSTSEDVAFEVAKRVYDFEFSGRERRERQVPIYFAAVGLVGTFTSGIMLPVLARDEFHLGSLWLGVLGAIWLTGTSFLLRSITLALSSLGGQTFYSVLGPEDALAPTKRALAGKMIEYSIKNYPIFNRDASRLAAAANAVRNAFVLLFVVGPLVFLIARHFQHDYQRSSHPVGSTATGSPEVDVRSDVGPGGQSSLSTSTGNSSSHDISRPGARVDGSAPQGDVHFQNVTSEEHPAVHEALAPTAHPPNDPHVQD
ncbi:MAG: hypothetical protein JWM10_714 [Myxococcaceae bacterium]|nr:hypothetical protein [Myxococcaceae bacterium]